MVNSIRKWNTLPGRRDVLALGGAAVAGLAAPMVALSQGQIVWNMATPWPRGTPGLYASAERLAAAITAMSGGRLKVVPHPAGELAPPTKVFDAVAGGVAEMGHGSSQYWSDKDPAFQFFTGVPFGMTANEHAGWIYHGGGKELWERAYGPFGVRPFLAGNSGPQGGGWFKKEIRNVGDFSGLRIRISGAGGEVLRLLGAEPVEIAPSDIFPAMQSGQLDAAEWVGPWNDLAFGFHKLARFYYLPAFHETGAAFELLVNAKAYDTLPEDLREIVRQAAMAASAETIADFTFHNAAAFDLIETRTGAVVQPFPPAVIKALGRTSIEMMERIATKSRLARSIYLSYFEYLDKAMAYASASELMALRQREEGRR